jgi:ATP-dependent DNA helicase RecG
MILVLCPSCSKLLVLNKWRIMKLKLGSEAVSRFGKEKRIDFEKIVLDKLPAFLDIEQKKNKVKNNLQTLKKSGVISNDGKVWKMSKQ